METASLIVLVAYTILAGVDGVNLHLVRYRLWERPESRDEHLVHTARALVFPLMLVLVFTGRTGPLLWLGVLVVAVDTVLELVDVRVEPASRQSLGGLSAQESLLHTTLVGLRAAAIALVFAAAPAGAWRWSGAAASDPSALSLVVVAVLLPGAVVTAGVHIWLARRSILDHAVVREAVPS